MSTEQYNPKKDRQSTKYYKLPELKDPMSVELKDSDEVLKTFKKWPLIPYASSDTGSVNGLLSFLKSLRFLSPTLGACHESIKTFAFGGKMDVEYVDDIDFVVDKPEMAPQLKETFIAFLKTLKTEVNYVNLSENLFSQLKDDGNIIVEIVHTQTLGVKSSAIYQHPTENCSYWATKKDEPLVMAISLKWDFTYLEKNPPKLIPIFPNYTLDENGSYRSIIHIKNGNFKYFGRPDWIASWRWAYNEDQSSDYLNKISAVNFTGQVLIELEEEDVENSDAWSDGDAEEEGYESMADKIERNLTYKADDPQTVIVTTRPSGAGNVFIHEFKLNTTENYYKVIGEIARQKIIENNQWSERLLGNAVAQGFANDSFMQELKIKEVSVLNYYRTMVCFVLNTFIAEAVKWSGLKQFEGLGVVYRSSFKYDDMKAKPKETLDAFGVGVRAGAITPNKDDEKYFRSLLQIAGTNAYTDESWTEDGNYRRPITLKGSEDSQSEATRTGDPQPVNEDPIEE